MWERELSHSKTARDSLFCAWAGIRNILSPLPPMKARLLPAHTGLVLARVCVFKSVAFSGTADVVVPRTIRSVSENISFVFLLCMRATFTIAPPLYEIQSPVMSVKRFFRSRCVPPAATTSA